MTWNKFPDEKPEIKDIVLYKLYNHYEGDGDYKSSNWVIGIAFYDAIERVFIDIGRSYYTATNSKYSYGLAWRGDFPLKIPMKNEREIVGELYPDSIIYWVSIKSICEMDHKEEKE